MVENTELKPLALWKAIIIFAITSGILNISIYIGIPFLLKNNLTFLKSYLICFYIPFILIFITAFVFFKMEHGKLDNFAERFRLSKLNKVDLLWTIGLFVFSIGMYLGLSFTGKLLAKIPIFAPPEYFPAEINPNKTMISGVFMDTTLKNQWWIIPAYALGWFFNIFGEEFLWRGYILPRQEIIHGKYAWLIHGSLWTIWHIFWRWNLILILPVAFSISFVVQKRKKTWIGIIAHGIANSIPLVIITLGVIG